MLHLKVHTPHLCRARPLQITCGDRNITKGLFFEASSEYMALGSTPCTIDIQGSSGDLAPVFGAPSPPSRAEISRDDQSSSREARRRWSTSTTPASPTASSTIRPRSTGSRWTPPWYASPSSVSRHLIQAQVRVIALGALADVRRLSLLGVSEECWNCALTPLTSNLAQPFIQWIDTRWAVDLTVNRSQRTHHSPLVMGSDRVCSAC